MVNEVAVISGKGGTGKTTVCAALGVIADEVVMADCDVDAPDLHILLHPSIKTATEFVASKVAVIDEDLCTECGLCGEACRFGAITDSRVDPISCEGCGVCEYVCPEEAIQMVDRQSGNLYDSDTRIGRMAHAKLLPGEGNSGRLVTEVRKLGTKIATDNGISTVLIDGSPGIGCPVIATVTGIKLGIIVTEPTMSGIHDMQRVRELLRKFSVKATVIINKFDLNLENTEAIERYCAENDVEVLGRIKFDPIMTKSMVAAQTLPEFAPDHEISQLLRKIWDRVNEGFSS
ncbi:MAG: Heterodisulfide reductase subunit A-like protein [Candidatus Thorarchaeota archaeon AB_25]|nr:MAG: Heterodisulfide reductase subunit A-like protein [Candidatus Thorarchaeota archaeon AB_25]